MLCRVQSCRVRSAGTVFVRRVAVAVKNAQAFSLRVYAAIDAALVCAVHEQHNGYPETIGIIQLEPILPVFIAFGDTGEEFCLLTVRILCQHEHSHALFAILTIL